MVETEGERSEEKGYMKWKKDTMLEERSGREKEREKDVSLE